MSSIDKRIVQMEFENKQFERNAQATIKTMDQLKKNMDFDQISKSMSNFEKQTKGFNLSGIAGSVSAIANRFSNLGIVGMTALQNLANSAINAGKQIANALTIQPVTTGFNEYELKMNSVQTIMASTGESLQTVNKYLEELNAYSDKTIYSFSDMKQNIGKFTNAGVSLDKAVKAIKGISNEAAVSGANTNEASRAMYNFAQALSSGYVKLVDWKSIELANMGTVEFKQQLIDTAVEMGTLVKQGDRYISTTKDMNGNISQAFNATSLFNESLSNQWMTSDVLVETLGKYADETTEIGKKAFAASQELKTFSQLFDTLKESAQSGWSQTWETIIGDFEGAKDVLSDLNTVFSTLIGNAADLRNNRLKEWADLGGREYAIAGVYNILTAIIKIIKPIKNAFREIFPRKTAQDLVNLTKKFEEFTRSLIPSPEVMDKIKRTAKGLFAVLDIGKTIVQSLAKGAFKVLSAVLGDVGDGVLDVTANVGDVLVKFRDWVKESGIITNAIGKLADGIVFVINKIKAFTGIIGNFIKEKTGIESFSDGVSKAFGGIKSAFSYVWDLIKRFVAYLQTFPKVRSFDDFVANLQKFGDDVKGVFKNALSSMKGFLSGAKSFTDAVADKLGPLGGVFKGIANAVGGAIEYLGGLLKKTDFSVLIYAAIGIGIMKTLSTIANMIEKVANALKPFQDLLKAASNALNGFATRLKAEALYTVAKAILALVTSLVILTQLDQGALWSSVGVLGVLAAALIGITLAASKLPKVNWSVTANIVALGFSLLLVVKALNSVDTGDGLEERVTVIIGALAALALLPAAMEKLGGGSKSGAASILALGISVKMIAGSLEEIGEIDGASLKKATGAVTEIIFILGIFGFLVTAAGNIGNKSASSNLQNAGKKGSKTSSGASAILAAAIGLKLIVSALKDLGDEDPGTIRSGLSSVEEILFAFGALMIASQFAGENAAKSGGMILMVTIALNLITPAIKSLASLNDGTLEQGMKAVEGIGLVFSALIAVSALAGKNAGKTAGMMLGFSAAMLILPLAIQLLADLDESAIQKGLGVIQQIGLVFGGLIAVSALATDSYKTINSIMVAVLLMTAAVAALTFIDQDKLDTSTKAFATIGIVFAAVIAASKLAKKATGAIVVITLCVAAIAGVLALLVQTPNIDKAFAAAKAISLVLVAVGATMVIISNAKELSNRAYLSLLVMEGVLLATGLVLGLLMQIPNIEQSLSVAEGLSLIMVALGTTAALMGNIMVSPATVIKVGGAIALIFVIMTAIVGLVGFLNQKLDGKLVSWMEDGIKIFELAGEAIGGFIGGIAKGIATNIADALPEIGEKLGAFFTNAQPFFDGLDNLTAAKLDAIGSLKDALGGFSLYGIENIPEDETLKNKFKTIGEGLNEFAKVTKDVDSASVESAANAASLLAKLENNLAPQGGVVYGWVMGEQSLVSFGNRLKQFGGALVSFSRTVTGSINEGAVTAATNAGTMLSDLENSLPSQGGALQDILGSQSLDDFGGRLVTFAEALVAFKNTVNEGGITQTSILGPKLAAQMLVDLQNSIGTKADGVFQIFTGHMDLDTFGDNLGEFADGLATFATKCADIDSTRYEGAKTVAQDLADFENTLRTTGGVISWFAGDASLDNFADNLTSLGDGLSAYFTQINGLDFTSGNMEKAIQYLKDVKAVLDSVVGLKDFGYDITDAMFQLVAELYRYPVKNETKLYNTGKSIIRYVYEGIRDGVEYYARFVYSEGAYLGQRLDEGIRSPEGLNEHSPSVKMKEVGKFAVLGLAEGIEQSNAAEEAAQKKGEAVVKAFESAFSRFDITKTTYDLEQKIWEATQGKGLSDAEKAQHQTDTLIKQLELQADRVQYAQAKYKTMVQQLGKDAEESRQAYNDWLQTQVDMYDIVGQIEELQGTQAVDARNAARIANNTYVDWMKENKDDLLALGIAMEDIEAAAVEISGIDKIFGKDTQAQNIQSIVDRAMTNVDVEVAAQKFSNGLATGIRRNTTAVTQAAAETSLAGSFAARKEDAYAQAGIANAEGLALGYASGKEEAIAVKRRASQDMMDALKADPFEISSPSKAFMQIGAYCAEGLAIGYVDQLGLIQTSMVMASERFVQTVNSIQSQVKHAADISADFTPTITPVLNLDEVSKGMSNLNGMINTSAVLDASFNVSKARIISANMDSSRYASPPPTSTTVNNNYNMTQNNTSPKALSQTEIYRQTRNLLSMTKGSGR